MSERDLTAREQAVLMLLGQGLSDEQIAAALQADPTSTRGAIQAAASYVSRRAKELAGHGLTSAETGVHELLQRGMSYPAIADELGIGKRKARLMAARVRAKTRAMEAPLAHATDLLSARQTQVAYLAASGLTDTEIAGRLRISVRTVQSHVSAALHALRISSRSQLAVTLGEVESKTADGRCKPPVSDAE